MKKILIFLLTVGMVILLPAAAFATSWGPDTDTDACMYGLEIDQYEARRDGTGAVGYYAYNGGAVSVGDYVYFTVSVTIPAHDTMIKRYGVDPGEDGSELQIGVAGVTPIDYKGSVSSAVFDVAIPAGASTARTLYYAPDGSWRTTVSASMWTAYVTSAASAAVSADISYDNGLKNISMQSGANTYRLISDSSGYIAYDAGTRMRITVDNKWRAAGAALSLDGGTTWHALYAARTGYRVEGDNAAGTWTGVAASYLSAFGFSFDELDAGAVYLSPRNVMLHFGPPAEISARALWAASSTVTTLPIATTPITAVPSTGTGSAIAAGLFMVGIIAFLFWPRRPRGKMA